MSAPIDDDLSSPRACPLCGDSDVPHLILRLGQMEPGELSWRCRTCEQEWSDCPVGRSPTSGVADSNIPRDSNFRAFSDETAALQVNYPQERIR